MNPGDWGTVTIYAQTMGEAFFDENNDTILNICRINDSENKSEFRLTTPVVSSLWINKTADKKTIYRDENITYTIKYGNAASFSVYEVFIVDILPDGVELLDGSNDDDNRKLIWNIGTLGPHASGTIVFTVHVPKLRMNFAETSSVKGDGYVYVRKFLSTAEEKPSLTNRATINGTYYGDQNKLPKNISASASVTIIGAAGTVVHTTEHGSGHYEEEERTTLKLENRSITLKKDIFAKHVNTSFSLPNNRTVKFESSWFDKTEADNRILGDVLTENYLYTDTLRKDISLDLDMNQTVYKSESDFTNGMVRIHYKQHTLNRPRSQKILKELGEDYHGSFKVMESIDSYGESVKYQKSSLGTGFVASDVRPDRLQRSYEYGSGYYSSEEASETGFLVKNVKMLYQPSNQTAGGRNLSYAVPWGEGMATKDPKIGLVISEGIRSATSVNKEAQMGKSFLSLLGDFNGTMELKMAMGPGPKNETHRVDQVLSGSFKTDTALSVSVIPKHLTPHLWISKEAIMTDPETFLFLINVTNDGNKLLGPLNITDIMPEGLIFLNSSMRPETNGQTIRWTVPGLEIGRTLTIKLYTRVREDISYPFVNRVSVDGRYLDQVAAASNYTRVDLGYLPIPKSRPELARVLEPFPERGLWGDWRPSPCFNMTAQTLCCYQEIENYYDQLDKTALGANSSPYEVP